MNDSQHHALSLRETDVEGAIRRLSGNEELYSACLKDFLEDTTLSELNRLIGTAHWDEAFTAAHALKGVAGNMGFVPLMHSVGQLVVLIRRGRVSEVCGALELVNSSYNDIVDGIHQYFAASDEITEGEAK